MTYTLNGTSVIQTNTDTSLSGMNGIPGVVVRQLTNIPQAVGCYNVTTYELSGLKLEIMGNLSIGDKEKLIFSNQASSNNILHVSGGGTLVINQPYTRNSYTVNQPTESIIFCLTSIGSWNTYNISVSESASLSAFNTIFKIPHSIGFMNTSTVYLDNCVIDKTGINGADIQTNLYAANVTIKNTKIYADGGTGITFRNATPPTIQSVSIYQAKDAWNNESGTWKLIQGLVPNVGSTVDVSQWGNNTQLVLNAVNGTQFSWGGHLPNDGQNTGRLGVYQNVVPIITNLAGDPISGAIFYLKDTNVAADPAQTTLFTPTGTTINPTTTLTYTTTSNNLGICATQTVLIGTGLRTTGGVQISGGNANRIRPRGKNTIIGYDATDDVYNVSALKYEYVTSTVPIILKGGANGDDVSAKMFLPLDVNITNSESTVAGISSINNLDMLYDYTKYWKTRNILTNLEYPTIDSQVIEADGTVLDIGTQNVEIDNTRYSTLWTPADISGGLAGWYDASDTSTVFSDVAATIPAVSGDQVGCWKDKSGNNRNVVSTSSISGGPVYDYSDINSTPILNFNGATFLATSGTATWLNNTNYTICGIGSVKNSGYTFGTLGSSTNVGLHFGWRYSTQITIAQYANDANYSKTNDNLTHIMLGIRTSPTTTPKLFYDGTEIISTGGTGGYLNTTGVFQIGTGYNTTTRMHGKMGEVVILSSDINTSDRQKLEGYLAWKWGIVDNLPIDHPYRYDGTLFIGYQAPIVVNRYTNTISIKTDYLENGTKFNAITTEGSISFINNPTISIDSYSTSGNLFVKLGVTNAISGSRIQLYNITDSSEIYNGIIGTSYSQYIQYTEDKNIRVRVAYQNGLTAYKGYENFGTLTENGLSFSLNQELCDVYGEIGIDGSTVTEFTADYPNVQIDVPDGDGMTTAQRLFVWYKYILTTEDGIRNFFLLMSPDDIVNYKMDYIQLENITVNPLILYGGRLYRSDGTTVICVSSGPIQLDPGKAYVANYDVIGTDLNTIKNNTNLIPALL